LKTLTNYSNLIETAVEKEYIAKKDVESLKQWKLNPQGWAESLVK